MSKHTSSAAFTYLAPIGMIVLGLIAVGVGAAEAAEDGTASYAWLFIALGLALLILFVASRGKFGVVSVTLSGVEVRQRGKRSQFQWCEVKSLSRIPFTTPPVFRLTFRNSDMVTYFAPYQLIQVETPVGGLELSGMESFMREQMKTAGRKTSVSGEVAG